MRMKMGTAEDRMSRGSFLKGGKVSAGDNRAFGTEGGEE